MTTMNGTANGLLVESTAKLVLHRNGDTVDPRVAPDRPHHESDRGPLRPVEESARAFRTS
jgi:hypothetical protein